MEFVIEGLCKSFDKKFVLNDCNFTFETGKIYGLLGRNGAGKTTLFNCINRDIDIDAGKFYFLENAGKEDIKTTDIGYVLSTPTVPEFLTAREFLAFFMDINREYINSSLPLESYFDLVHIKEDDRGRLLKEFSHGMKNKMQMLVNFIANPKLLLLDEPLTSLDVVVAEEMKTILRNMKGDRVTILSTHILDLALDMCDEIVLLHNGRLEHIDIDMRDEEETRAKIIAALSEEEV